MFVYIKTGCKYCRAEETKDTNFFLEACTMAHTLEVMMMVIVFTNQFSQINLKDVPEIPRSPLSSVIYKYRIICP